MSSDFSPKDLDALIAYISEAVDSAPGNDGALVRIAETVQEYARSARDGRVRDPEFLKALLLKVSPRSAASPGAVSRYEYPLAFQQPAAERDMTVPKVKNADGRQIVLGKCLGRGGEGSVYKVPSLPGKVAKIYFRDRLAGRAAQMERKIKALCRKKRVAHIAETLVAAIPDELLYFSDGEFAGYLMPQFSTTMRIYEVQRADRRGRLFPDLDYRGLIAIAYNLAEAVDHLHKNGIVIGDMNQNNILIHQDGVVALIDCDSFDITDPDTGEHFPCVVGLQELLAPELQVGKLSEATFTKESDCFSLAVHIFRLLMNNADPFAAQITGDAQHSSESMGHNNTIINGECVYVRDIPGKTIPRWSPALEILPAQIQALFRRVFDYTAATAGSRIAQRPTAAEWMDALHRFYQMPMKHCSQDPFHWHMPSLSECPFCRQ